MKVTHFETFLTNAGLRTVEEMERTGRARMNQIFGRLSHEELQRLVLALRDLATLGLVDLQPYRGARVRRPSMQEQVEAMRVRAELEAMAAREAAGRLTEDQVSELRRLNEEMADLAAAGDTHGHALKNTEFHSIVVQASGNRTLERLLAMLQPFAQTYLTAAVAGLDPPQVYAARHASILDALVAGDPDRAEHAMRAHGRANVAAVMEAREALAVPTEGDRG